MLVAKKWDYSERRKSAGRPRVKKEIVDLVLRFARENPSWGYDKIQGALANLGHNVSDQTVGNILKEHGIEPAGDRKRQTTWKTFIKSFGNAPIATWLITAWAVATRFRRGTPPCPIGCMLGLLAYSVSKLNSVKNASTSSNKSAGSLSPARLSGKSAVS